MLLYNYIPHYIFILYRPISSPLNPKIIFPCMFLNHIQEHFHPHQCVLSSILTLLCLCISDMMMSKKLRYLIPLFQINRF